MGNSRVKITLIILAIFSFFAAFWLAKPSIVSAACQATVTTLADKSNVRPGDSVSFTTVLSAACAVGAVDVQVTLAPAGNLNGRLGTVLGYAFVTI